MLTYLCFARWFGLVSLFLSLGILFNLDDAKEMAKRMVKEDSGYIMGGVLPVIFGTLAITCYHSVSFGWEFVVTMAGVATTVAGLFRVLFVRQWKSFFQSNVDKIPLLFALFGLMFGLLLIYVGYISPLVRYHYAML